MNFSAAEKKQVAPIFDYQLESLRGLAAFVVVLAHVFSRDFHLDPAYRMQGILQFTPPGHLSVIVFFILSGYVIGLTNQNPISTNTLRYEYLKKRLVRLYPLYIVAIVLTILISAACNLYYSYQNIAWHLMFGQVAMAPVLHYNLPLWSLSYEIVYYVLFLVLSTYKINPLRAALIFLLLGLISRICQGPMASSVVSYSYGACFWFIGVAIAKMPRENTPINYGALLAMLVLMLSYERLNLVASFIERTGLDFTEHEVPSFFQRAISLSDLSYLIFCLPLIMNFTNRSFKGMLLMERLSFVIPGLYLVVYVVSGKILQEHLLNTLYIPGLLYVASILIYLFQHEFNDIGNAMLKKVYGLGSVSYGIYIIHFPILMLFNEIDYFSGSGFTFTARVAIYLVVVFALGYLLERRFQPWIKAKLM
ncbi:acyltransferase [Hymenobacter sp. BT18]|uniref:acyltransferase family protein n=1 Tax=Hymenobacter sp. BT18 TaxID=2835648 RepID=UPI00143E5725|nr:acyltransferase [Hymenobacter sp. BT18]QIX63014.1 acyltransferase [Hymenobacter sp. BT18]